MVVITAPSTELTGTEQDRVATPSTWTVQAPHWAIPQPYRVPVRPSVSRNTHSRGVSGSTSTCRAWPLILRLGIVALLDRVPRPAGSRYVATDYRRFRGSASYPLSGGLVHHEDPWPNSAGSSTTSGPPVSLGARPHCQGNDSRDCQDRQFAGAAGRRGPDTARVGPRGPARIPALGTDLFRRAGRASRVFPRRIRRAAPLARRAGICRHRCPL